MKCLSNAWAEYSRNARTPVQNDTCKSYFILDILDTFRCLDKVWCYYIISLDYL